MDARDGERWGSRHERRVFALDLAALDEASPEAAALVRGGGVRRVRFTFGAVRQMDHATQMQLAEARVLGPAEDERVSKEACAAHGGWGTGAVVGFAVAVALAVALAAWGLATWRRGRSERGLRRRYSTRLSNNDRRRHDGGGGGGGNVGAAPPSPIRAATSGRAARTSFSSARAFWTAGAHAGDGGAQTGAPAKKKTGGGAGAFLAGLFAGRAKAKAKGRKAKAAKNPALRKMTLAQQPHPTVNVSAPVVSAPVGNDRLGGGGGRGVPPASWFSSRPTRQQPRALPASRALATGAAPALARAPARPRPLPRGWEAVQDGDGDTYFWHRETGETTWDRPAFTYGRGRG